MRTPSCSNSKPPSSFNLSSNLNPALIVSLSPVEPTVVIPEASYTDQNDDQLQSFTLDSNSPPSFNNVNQNLIKSQSHFDENEFICPNLFHQSSLSKDLQENFVKHGASQSLIADILSTLRKHGHEDLPKDARTFMSTPRSGTHNIYQLDGGTYLHFGLTENIIRVIKKYNYYSDDILKLNINIDGLPVAKSSRSQLWPILGDVLLKGIHTDPFTIGIFHGSSKPKDCREFLKHFIEEYRELELNGLLINSKKIKIKLNCIICDAPAKAFVLNILGQTGYFSCTKCVTEGDMFENKKLVLSEPSQLSEIHQPFRPLATYDDNDEDFVKIESLPIVFEGNDGIGAKQNTVEEASNSACEGISNLEFILENLTITCNNVQKYVISIDNRLKDMTSNQGKVLVDDVIKNLEKNLPLNSQESVRAFDTLLNTKAEVKNTFAQFIKRIGGRDAKDINRCLPKLFTNEFAKESSYLGLRGNFKLQQFNFMQILIATSTSIEYIDLSPSTSTQMQMCNYIDDEDDLPSQRWQRYSPLLEVEEVEAISVGQRLRRSERLNASNYFSSFSPVNKNDTADDPTDEPQSVSDAINDVINEWRHDDNLDVPEQGTEFPKSLLVLHRGHIFEELLDAVKTHKYNDFKEIQIEMILPNGTAEIASDAGGVLRDAIAEFWETFYAKCSTGTDLKIPYLRHDFQKGEWQTIGKILIKGLEALEYFPVKLAPVFMKQCFRKTVQDEEYIRDFLKYVCHSDALLLKTAIDNFEDVDFEELLEFCSNYNAKWNPSKENIKTLIKQIAKEELLQKTAFVKECFALECESICLTTDLDYLYKKLEPSDKNIIALFDIKEDDLSVDKLQVYKHLKKFIKEEDQKVKCAFLRFCTGSDLPVQKIRIEFTNSTFSNFVNIRYLLLLLELTAIENLHAEPENNADIPDKMEETKNNCTLDEFIPGDFVIGIYDGDGEYYPGQIENINDGEYEISTMEFSKTSKLWKWPNRKDKIWYKKITF
ncbi:unnamed protein product [Ceutorhynchus assimilis]|uniref:DUF4806 domain-containing protein n=1 Tax=Ceutorhynchus assimilis TaxID=467358 RepID=A0A9N9QMC6_9CUCU|nr:unnamed protein product [Ceutorhynchus assimilis]